MNGWETLSAALVGLVLGRLLYLATNAFVVKPLDRFLMRRFGPRE